MWWWMCCWIWGIIATWKRSFLIVMFWLHRWMCTLPMCWMHWILTSVYIQSAQGVTSSSSSHRATSADANECLCLWGKTPPEGINFSLSFVLWTNYHPRIKVLANNAATWGFRGVIFHKRTSAPSVCVVNLLFWITAAWKSWSRSEPTLLPLHVKSAKQQNAVSILAEVLNSEFNAK